MKAPSIENMSIWNETVYHLELNSMRLFDEIMEMLGRIEPMRSNSDYKRIWLSEERLNFTKLASIEFSSKSGSGST